MWLLGLRCRPRPDVPDRLEPLGPGSVGIPLPRAPNWSQFVASYAPSVRELPPGDRPKDWVDSSGVSAADVADATPLREEVATEAPACSVPQRYRVEFTASQEYVDLLERAQDLLSHAVPNRSLEEVHVRALRLLVEKLERRKYGAPRKDAARPRAPAAPESSAMPSDGVDTVESKKHAHTPRQRVSPSAQVRREVHDRDGERCTFADDSGQRCRETRFLQLHHIHAHAKGGDRSAANLTQRCQAHNGLAAEQDFGRAFIQRRQRGQQAAGVEQ